LLRRRIEKAKVNTLIVVLPVVVSACLMVRFVKYFPVPEGKQTRS
jgi:hypothetical protein